MAAPKLPHRARRSGPGSKTRSGCVTCKARRVKCDETLPTCLRCQSMHIDCGGYIKKEKPKLVKSILPLAPKIPALSKRDPPSVALVYPPSPNGFASDREFQYFKTFCNITAPDLAEFLDPVLWNRIVLQASQQEVFIKQAVIALGALSKSHADATNNRSTYGRALMDGSAHYQVAFLEYGNSIRGIRKACEEQRRSKRSILIACMLAVCFEYYHGNIGLAIAHASNGIKLVDEWLQTLKHMAKATAHRQAFLEGFIEDELISIFGRLSIDTQMWIGVEPVRMHPDLQNTSAAIIQSIPTTQGFPDLTSARKYFDILMTSVDMFVYSVYEKLWATAQASEPLTADVPLGVILPSPNQRTGRDFLEQGISSWQMAFRPIYKQSLRSGGSDLLIAKAISLHLICSSINLRCCFGPELSYDEYLPDFKHALSLAKALASAVASKHATFVLSSILIKSLFNIVWKSRSEVRNEAISLLQTMSRREGLWDSRVAFAMAKVVRKLEQEGEGGHSIPENMRLRAIQASWDLHRGTGTLRYLRPATDTITPGYEVQQVEFPWDSRNSPVEDRKVIVW